jgi:hypothetical protein
MNILLDKHARSKFELKEQEKNVNIKQNLVNEAIIFEKAVFPRD